MLKQNLFICCICISLFLSSCGTNKSVTPSEDTTIATKHERKGYHDEILSIFELLDSQQFTEADKAIKKISTAKLNQEELLLIETLKAHKLNIEEKPTEALQLLSTQGFIDKQILSSRSTQAKIQAEKIISLNLLSRHADAAKLRIYMAANLNTEEALRNNAIAIWLDINQLNEFRIKDELSSSHNKDYQQWLTLNMLVRFNKHSLNKQINDIEQWQHQNPQHTAALVPPQDIINLRLAAKQRPHKIAIILPFDRKYKNFSNAIRNGFMQSYYQSDYQPLLSFYAVDQQQDFLDVYHTAINEGAELIIGPIFKNQLTQLYQLEELPVPTISLNRLDNKSLTPLNLFEFSLASEDEIDTMIQQLSLSGYKNALVFLQSSSWAKEDSEYFSQQWQNKHGNILAEQAFDSNKDQSRQLQKLLNIDKSKYRIHRLNSTLRQKLNSQPRRRQDADFIYLLAKPDKASSIKPMLKFHYAGDLPSYASSRIYRGYANKSLDNDLNGITFTDLPWLTHKPKNIDAQYRQSPLLRMYAFGVDAFQLSERLNLLKNNKQLSLNGATGKLSLSNNKLKRQTAIAVFSKGKIQEVPIKMHAKLDMNKL